MHTERKKWCRVPQLYELSSEKWNIHYTLLSAMFNPLHSSANQELFEKHYNQNSHYENYGWFPEAITCYRQNRHFLLSEKMNGTQRRTLVSPWRMHCTYCGMPKGTSWAKATLNSEKNQARSLSRYQVILIWRYQSVSQSVPQSVENSIIKKKNSVGTCWKSLGSMWRLVWAKFCLTNTASSSSGKSEANFWVMLFHWPRLLLCGPYYTVLSYCMITFKKKY